MPAPAFADADPEGPGDEALMLAYADGDAGAFDALYARHKGGVYRYLVRHCGNAGTADELFQDVCTNVTRARAACTPSARFATWLYRIAHNRRADRQSARSSFLIGAGSAAVAASARVSHVSPGLSARGGHERTAIRCGRIVRR